jgi:hypothetical protein
MYTVVYNAQELADCLPGMSLATAIDLLIQADKRWNDGREEIAAFIATSRNGFGELLHEAKWEIYRDDDSTYSVHRMSSYTKGE